MIVLTHPIIITLFWPLQFPKYLHYISLNINLIFLFLIIKMAFTRQDWLMISFCFLLMCGHPLWQRLENHMVWPLIYSVLLTGIMVSSPGSPLLVSLLYYVYSYLTSYVACLSLYLLIVHHPPLSLSVVMAVRILFCLLHLYSHWSVIPFFQQITSFTHTMMTQQVHFSSSFKSTSSPHLICFSSWQKYLFKIACDILVEQMHFC